MRTISHSEHRYAGTCGDWWFDKDGTLEVRVSKMGDIRYEFLVARHEIDEAFLCWQRGISEDSVTAFDVMFELEREQGEHSQEDEPGDDIRAPYRKEHRFATQSEKVMARQLKVPWKEYSKAVEAL
jgi:hypothetical protein